MAARSNVYHTLFDRMSDGYCVIEFRDGPHGPLSDYVHVAANPAYTANAGIDDIVGKYLRQIVGPDEAEAWLARYGEVLRTGEPIRFEQELVATGRYLELFSYRLGEESDRMVAVLFKDVTDRKHAEAREHEARIALEERFAEALKERALLAQIVENSDAMLQVVDMEGRWLAINRAAAEELERIFGIRPQVGLGAADLLADRPEHLAQLREIWGRALAGEQFVELAEVGDPALDRRHYEMHFDTLRDADGRQVGAYQFVYDVTERIETAERLSAAESALRQSQKMEAVGQLTGGLAHDFNNLLGGVSGALDRADRRLEEGRIGDAARYVDAARQAVERAAALTHRLLAFSRRQTLTPSLVDVRALVEGVLDLVRRSVGPAVDIVLKADGDLWPVRADANQLENALLNLCLNGRDAMPDGGRLTITLANRSAAMGEDARVKPGDYLEIAVADTGVGIAEGDLERVFEPFFTTKPMGSGTGLGLSMVYGFVKQSRGNVLIASQPGEGTRVTLLLPRETGAAPGTATNGARADGTAAPQGSGTVLVVDDEVLIRMTVVEELTDLGYTCVEAGTGQAALDLLAQRPEIALLLTDVGLPGGLNGRQVAETARQRRPDLPVIFITGYAEQFTADEGDLPERMAVLTKPFRMAELVTKVGQLIAS
jgi:hypothetical protein